MRSEWLMNRCLPISCDCVVNRARSDVESSEDMSLDFGVRNWLR